MSKFLIDDQASPDFRRHLKSLEKKFPRISEDLADLYCDVSDDYKHACHSTPVPGYGGKVWKYRCPSRDMQKGKSGAFRILVLCDEQRKTLYPLALYAKSEYEQPPMNDVRSWLKNAVLALKSLPLIDQIGNSED